MKLRSFLGKLYIVAFIAVLLCAIAAREGRFLGYLLNESPGGGTTVAAFSLEEAQLLLPGASSIKILDKDEAMVSDASGKNLGRLLHTQPLARQVTGYASWLPIVIGIDRDQKITGLILQKNDETPGFIKRLDKLGFFNSWNGQNASDAVLLNVDAVSRATMTSHATIESVRLRLAKHLEVEQSRQKTDLKAIAIEVVAWAFLLISVLACFSGSGLARHRNLILVLAVLVPGFALGRFVSVELVYAWALNGIPYSGQLFLVVVMALAVLIPLFTGKAYYCTWYCPYGAAQELTGKLCAKKFDATGSAGRFFRQLRPSVLMVVTFLLIVGVKVNLNSIEPFSAFLLESASATVIVLAVLFLFVSIFVRRPWCNFFCPSGQIVEILRVGMSATAGANEGKVEVKETGHMKVQEVINLLLAIAVIILLMAPTRIAHNGVEGTRKEVTSNAARSGTSQSTQVASPAAQTALSSEKSVVPATGNQTLATIYQRKSVRNFTGQVVTREQLTELVKAGMAAPTAMNRQPWQFIVISEKASIETLADKLPYAKMLSKAGAAIIVCGDLEIAKAGNTELMWMLDCSAATQNILLAAESMGLGAVWTAAYPYEDRIVAVNEVVKLPASVVPLCVIPIGYPTGSDQPKDKWKPERLHWNTFTPQVNSVASDGKL